MTSIWGFFLQTLYVSLTAGVILLLKRILNDKLSPRWQYGVWILIAVRILIPVSWERYVLLPLNAWVEALRVYVERGLDSVYTQIYQVPNLYHIFPMFGSAPQSITDWLLVIYAIGIVAMLLWYLASYIRLRFLLRQGRTASANVVELIDAVCERYGLKSCRCIVVDGLRSAFICGIFSPILVVGSENGLDEKIILHELLHLKNKDALQNMGWCILRSLHWCNPFMHMVFNRIENDMESLCDQRVLELLKGEERREYGQVLLGMANDKYARTFGTSSISNGGKNIARRIQAIVRFKKYPKGMGLVSLCIVLVLGWPIVVGTENTYAEEDFRAGNDIEFEIAMAGTRINRCGTVAGALDTYAKGLILGNGIYLATASPLDEQAYWIEEMQTYMDGVSEYYLDAGYGFSNENVDMDQQYLILNLKEVEKNVYEAYLAFQLYDYPKGYEPQTYTGEDRGSCSLLVPVQVYYENGWVVEELGGEADRIVVEDTLHMIKSALYRLDSGDISLYSLISTWGPWISCRLGLDISFFYRQFQ